MYQALYRKYRPFTFSDVYGQDHITETLKNSLAGGKVFHAYLFTGTRGTGKTSCAKILAKAVCCLNPQNGEPCGTCSACKSIAEGSATDVLEIDAASNNGVNDIRDLKEQVNFLPVALKYRVYIIDEVHMLSTSAFNALLKTLEEPPAHVVFILATTEVHKLPATILSRCQRFDFKRLEPEVICKRMQYIANNEGFTLEDGAATLIAGLADGGMRDALSILDQCSSCTNNITEQVIMDVCGIAGSKAVGELTLAITNKNAEKAISILDLLYKNSVDMKKLLFELVSYYRNLMVIKTVKQNRNLIVCSETEYLEMCNLAEGLTLSDIMQNLSVLQQSAENIRSSSARTDIELIIIKLCTPELGTNIEALQKRIERLEQALQNTAALDSAAIGSSATNMQPKKTDVAKADTSNKVSNPPVLAEIKNEAEELPPIPDDSFVPTEDYIPEATKNEVQPLTAANKTTQNGEAKTAHSENTPVEGGATPVAKWAEVLDILKTTCPLLAGVLSSSKAYTEGGRLLIDCNLTQFRDLINSDAKYRNYLRKAAEQVLGVSYNLGPYNPKKATVNKSDPLAAFAKSLDGKNL